MSELTLAESICERAHQLWQLDGSLEGCADEYWRLARVLVEEEFGRPVVARSSDSEPVAPR
ncbi:hypothetical protein LMG28614_04693 [Paraburkholderia ultramafica]|uniref:DUF2934 domain-containing protein n=1 Tax=Paraburkholderia ultramafica TaxID=1544867 RepID=A0A6S7BET0_9BURK|nr:DUF2934 domain-containing protein [Paraburkholderia ultramafica]CAB3797998.1 hypothetical protein LMG28614_04693 [Paraburkholderia ultramafica]